MAGAMAPLVKRPDLPPAPAAAARRPPPAPIVRNAPPIPAPGAANDAGPPKPADGKPAPADGKSAAPKDGQPRAAANAGVPAPDTAKPGGQALRSGKASRRDATGGKDPTSADAVFVPIPQTGHFQLASARLDLPAASAQFDAPRSLGVRASAPRTDADGRNPAVVRAPAAFAEAAAAAARLHAGLVADAANAAQAARATAAARFDAIQSNLDNALGRLDAGLDSARFSLFSDAGAALAVIETRAATARSQINRAASNARAKLKAAAKKLHADFKEPEARVKTVESDARAKADDIVTDGEIAANAMEMLATNPKLSDTSGDAMQVAQGETIVAGMPQRAALRGKFFTEQSESEEAFLTGPLNRLHNLMAAATRDFDEMVAKCEVIGPQAVDRAQAGAIAQVGSTVEQLSQAIERARDTTEAALVRQHDAGRKQLIGAAGNDVTAGRAAATARGTGDVNQALAQARGQGGAIKAMEAGFGNERGRSQIEFATVVVRAAGGMTDRLRAQAAVQHPKLAAAAREGRAGLDRDAAAANTRLRDNADANAASLTGMARDVGAGLVPQAEDGCAGLKTLAGPVAGSIKDYLPPIEKTGAEQIRVLNDAIAAAEKSIAAAFDGDGGGPDPDAPPPGTVPAVTIGPPAPPEKKIAERMLSPNDFAAAARMSSPLADKDALIAAFITAAKETVNSDITKRFGGLSDQLHRLRSDVDAVQEHLRGLTAKRGSAVREMYQRRWTIPLDDRIEDKLTKWLSSGATNRHNVAAAIANLNGNSGKGALEEMAAAKGWWNDDARVDKALRALTPAQLGEMARAKGGTEALDAIEAQLEGVDKQVFQLLRDAEAHPENVAHANALRLQQSLSKARDKHGDEGFEAAHQAFADATAAAGDDTLSIGPALDAGLRVHDTLGNELYDKTSKKAWQQTLGEFDTIVGPAKDDDPVLKDKDGNVYAGPGAGAYRYAIANRTYYTGGGKENPRVKHVDALTKAQKTSLEAELVYGANSDEDKGGRVAELKSRGGKPDPKKVEAIMHDPSLDAKPGEVVSPEVRTQRELEARNRYDRIYEAYEIYSRPPGGTKRSIVDAKQEVVNWAFKSHSGDKEEQAYVVSLLKDPVPDTTATFNFAIEGWGSNTDLLKQTFGRMTPAQVDDAVKDYNAKHPNGPSLYARLGIFGESSIFSKLSGDKRNDVEIAAMGVPVTDTDKLQVARMVLKQQKDQASWLSKHVLAKDEFDLMVETSKQLEQRAGFTHEQFENNFDARGRFMAKNPATGEMNPLGNFTKGGKFLPATHADANAFNSAVIMAQLDATNYKETTDRVANFVTTAIVIAAAIISTIATFGTAAAFWGPVLITAGAGLLGMGASALIKGGRYGRDDILHDLAMTVIQSATAGIGAGLGAAMKGGGAGLRMVLAGQVEKAAVAAAVAEETAIAAGQIAATTAERTAERATLISLGKSLSLTQEVAVGAASSAFSGGATAAIDVDAWRQGRYGAGIFHGVVGGTLSGGTGALAAHLGASAVNGIAGTGRKILGIEKLADGARAHWAVGGLARVTGSASAGFAQSMTEGGYRAAAQGREIKFSELAAEGGWAALQNAAQSIGEHGVDESQHRQEEAHVKAATVRAPAPEHEAARPAPRAANDAEPAARLATENEAAAKPRPVEPVKPHAAGDPATPARRKPPPLPEAARRAGAKSAPVEIIEVMEPGWGIMAGNATDRTDAAQIYKTLIKDQPHLEVGTYKNTKTGEYVTFQGTADEVHAGKNAAGETEAPRAEGNAQRWKELLKRDHGDWELQAHYHPVPNDTATSTDHWHHLPSAEGGDFHAIQAESMNRDVSAPRESILNYMVNGQLEHMRFGFDPHSVAERYWVEVPGATSGTRERKGFPNLEKYREFFTEKTGKVMVPQGPLTLGSAAPLAMPRSAAAETPVPLPPPDAITFYHGTTAAGQEAMERHGVKAVRGSGAGDDYGAAFYVTPQQAVGEDYARDRASRTLTTRTPSEGRMLAFSLPREALGIVVDIRPGGPQRAAFEAWMQGPSPFAGSKIPGHDRLPQTLEAFIVSPLGGHDMCGVYFEKFLTSIGMNHADIVIGDLGGIGTKGIGANQPGAEQIAIRSQRLADLLTGQLPGRAGAPGVAGEPANDPGVKPRASKVKNAPAAKPAATATEAGSAEPGTGTATPKTRDRRQGRAVLDPDASARAATGVAAAERQLRELANDNAAAGTALMFGKEGFAALAAQRPQRPPELEPRIAKSLRDADKDTRSVADSEQRKLAKIARRLDHMDAWLHDPGLSEAARTFVEWQVKMLSFQLGQEESLRTTAAAPATIADARDIKLPAAISAQRDANRGVKDLVEKRGPNYRSMKRRATFDGILEESRFIEQQKLRKAAGLDPVGLSPDHLMPLDEIANMKELVPLLALYKEAPAAMRTELERFLTGLGDVRENLVAMRSDANVELKNALHWDQVNVPKALSFGYTATDIERMHTRQVKMRAEIKRRIAAAIDHFKLEVAKTPAAGRRAELAIGGGDPDNE